MFRTVLDIDFTSRYSKLAPMTKEELKHILIKISKCPFFIRKETKPSSSKGIHVILFCRKECDLCRICFDDDRHYNYDMARPEYARNILFDKKEKIKI